VAGWARAPCCDEGGVGSCDGGAAIGSAAGNFPFGQASAWLGAVDGT